MVTIGIVARRHFGLSHGVGRSGNLIDPQPKAIGSTILAGLTNQLVLDVFHKIGLSSCQRCLVMPMATGMTMMLCLLHLKRSRPGAKYVLWSRIDQKSCIKCILSAGGCLSQFAATHVARDILLFSGRHMFAKYIHKFSLLFPPKGLDPVIIHTKADENGQLVTDVDAFRAQVQSIGPEQIVCLLSCTSCFAPRATDKVVELANLAAKFEVPHLINNAYGLTSSFTVHQIEQACRKGRVDMYVQSTDKNFLVPVGGAIVASSNAAIVDSLAQMYPGRGSSSQIADLLITLIEMGRSGYKDLLAQRKENFEYLKERLMKFCEDKEKLSVIQSKDNRISIALAIDLPDFEVNEIGSKLFKRHVMGVRAIPKKTMINLEGLVFESWGNHTNDAMPAYLTLAAAIGMTKNDVDMFIGKLADVL